ncbi:MAG: hypothetical protein F4X16_08660 [Caldilineaceae bacterium SB0661_bin_34]|nr:hypothetical protein [Caldilineaceae bacterium SB0661_bin_34]
MNDLIARFDTNRPLLRTMYGGQEARRGECSSDDLPPNSHVPRGTKGRRIFDSANPARESRDAFEFYWETVLFLKKTDPKLLGFNLILDSAFHKIVDTVRPGVAWRRSQ